MVAATAGVEAVMPEEAVASMEEAHSAADTMGVVLGADPTVDILAASTVENLVACTAVLALTGAGASHLDAALLRLTRGRGKAIAALATLRPASTDSPEAITKLLPDDLAA